MVRPDPTLSVCVSSSGDFLHIAGGEPGAFFSEVASTSAIAATDQYSAPRPQKFLRLRYASSFLRDAPPPPPRCRDASLCSVPSGQQHYRIFFRLAVAEKNRTWHNAPVILLFTNLNSTRERQSSRAGIRRVASVTFHNSRRRFIVFESTRVVSRISSEAQSLLRVYFQLQVVATRTT